MSRMKLKIAAIVLLTINLVLSVAAVGSAFTIPDTIYIRPDGSISPQSAPISRAGNVYTLTDHITSQVVIECNGIVFNGAGYSIKGDGWGVGLNLTCMNVEVKAVRLDGWQAGVLGVFNNNTIKDCMITGCADAFKIYAQYYVIVGNTVANNDEAVRVGMGGLNFIAHNYFVNNKIGFALYDSDNAIIQNTIVNCSDTVFRLDNLAWTQTVYHNNFVGNAKSVSDFTYSNSLERPVQSQVPTWDNGVTGNYWSDYKGTDSNGDGVGDSPMQISTYYRGEIPSFYSFQDRYPLTSQYDIDLPVPPIPQALIAPSNMSAVDNRDKALSFMKDVVGIDLAKYTPTSEYSNIGVDASTVSQNLQYTFKQNNRNMFYAIMRFTNTSLTYFDLNLPSLSDWQPQNSYDDALRIIKNYQGWTADPDVTGMVNQLVAAGPGKNVTSSSGNLSFELQTDSQQTTCNWNITYNGASYSGLKLLIADYGNGYTVHFEDTRAVTTIGDTHIGITEAQAKAIAEQYVRDSFAYPHDFGNGSIVFVNGLKTVDENTTAVLASANRYDSALYPCWNVYVPLDHVYNPGSVSAVNVRVWAGDGEVFSARTLSEYNPGWHYEPPILFFGISSFLFTLLALGIGTGIVLVIVLVVVLKKTEKPRKPVV